MNTPVVIYNINHIFGSYTFCSRQFGVIIPFISVHVAAEDSQRQEGRRALWMVVLLQETGYV